MPNRIIKESICTSESMAKLSWFEQAVFIRLIVLADDYGRFDARAAIIKGRGFPLYSVTDKQINDALSHLGMAGMVNLYTVGDKPYLQLKTWENHQAIRAKKSKYPEPNNDLPADESNCLHLYADTNKCPRNPIQSESNPNPNPNPNAQAREDAFDTFWASYPRKVAKAEARKAWGKVDLGTMPEIMAGLNRAMKSEQWYKDGGKFIPHPATWIRGERWKDEIPGEYDNLRSLAKMFEGE